MFYFSCVKVPITKKSFLLLLFVLSVIFGAKSQSTKFVHQLSSEEYIKRIKFNLLHLCKEDSLQQIVKTAKDSLFIYKDLQQDTLLYQIAYNDIIQFENAYQTLNLEALTFFLNENKVPSPTNGQVKKCIIQDSLPLQNWKIALDPGHIAGSLEMAKIEGKFIEFTKKKNPTLDKNISFYEANLTLATALLVKDELTSLGANVFLTRSKPDLSAFGITYSEWLRTDFHRALDSVYATEGIDTKLYKRLKYKHKNLTTSSKKYIFHYLFKHLDNIRRAEIINQSAPDITLIIHYNVDEKNGPWQTPTQKNFNMTFVPGSFMKQELRTPAHYIEFIRLLITDDISSSIEFSNFITQSISNQLDIPLADTSDAIYLKKYCIKTNQKGVFCRNLSLTRNVHSTLCYGETIYQDNINEFLSLGKSENVINGITYSKRIKEVAHAYTSAIIKYTQLHKK